VKEVGNQCEMCGSSRRLNLHHIVPVRSGGPHDQWNTLLLCPQCHGSAESYLSDIFDTHILGGKFLRLKDVVDGKRYTLYGV
jgi:5-methylcytosine-specific restriction endonuclease McrA